MGDEELNKEMLLKKQRLDKEAADKKTWEYISAITGLKFHLYFPVTQHCPVCKTNENKPCIILPIAGSVVAGKVSKAMPVHLKCLKLWWFPPNPLEGMNYAMIIQRVNG